MLLVVVLVTTATAVLLPLRGLVERHRAEREFAVRRVAEPRQGPALLTDFKDLVPKGAIRGADDRPVLVVYGGSRERSSPRDVGPRQVLAGRFQAVVFVYRGEPTKLPKEFAPPFYTVWDRNGSTARRLDAAWSPRFYVLTPQGRFMKAQQPNEETSIFGVMANG